MFGWCCSKFWCFPQGSVLAPLLFFKSTTKFQSEKYAGNLALLASLRKGGHSWRGRAWSNVSPGQKWWGKSFLGTRTCLLWKVPCAAIKRQILAVVNKILGTYVDHNVNFSENADCIFKTCNQRPQRLSEVNSFRVSKHIIETVYKKQIEGI